MPELDGTEAYHFGSDGDGEETLWHDHPEGAEPTAVIRRCDNPHAFDLLHALIEGVWLDPDR